MRLMKLLTGFCKYVAYRSTSQVRAPGLFLLCAAFLSTAGRAAMPDRGIKDMYHKSWTAKDGVPPRILALARVGSGYLYIGAADGLYQFDGVTFERVRTLTGEKPAQVSVTHLFESSDGGLWFSYSVGGVALLKDGRIRTYSNQDGEAMSATFQFKQDSDGKMWRRDGSGVISGFDGSQWHALTPDRNVPPGPKELYTDGNGNLWASSDSGVSCLPRGGKTFISFSYASTVPTKDRHPKYDYAIKWKHDFDGPDKPVCNAFYIPHYQVVKLDILFDPGFVDAAGAQWSWTLGAGIRRDKNWRGPLQNDGTASPVVEREDFTKKDGLTNDFVRDLVMDKEGNVWAGTNGGLDLFRDVPIANVTFPPDAAGLSLLAGDHGQLFATSLTGKEPLVEIVHGKVVPVHMSEPIRYVGGAFLDRKGVIWMGTLVSGLVRFEKGTSTVFDTGASYTAPWAEDREGRLWVRVVGKGILRFEDGKLGTNLLSLGVTTPGILAGSNDPSGRLWFGHSGDVVTMVDGRTVVQFTKDNGVSVGNVTFVTSKESSVWIGGDHGLELLEGKSFVSLIPSDKPSFVNVSGVVETPGDGLWLGENGSIIHIAESELLLFRKDRTHRVRYRLFNYLDGLSAFLPSSPGRPSMVATSDGLLWFATTAGIAWIDPAHVPDDSKHSEILIKSIVSNGRINEVGGGVMRLPARTTSIEIDYTALSLAFPERTLFRYQLSRVDKGWQEASTRRQAFYTNLGPGKYRFQVVAYSGNGIWNTTGAATEFVIAPAFYQTWWCRTIYIASALGALWVLYLRRLKQATAQVQERLGARMEERERIARELHDTLLQGFHGLMLRFQAVIKVLPSEGPARQMMEHALDRADDVLLKGRESVRDLRESGASAGELSEVLAAAGVEFAQSTPIVFGCVVAGESEPLNPVVFNETYRIALEAIANAFQHSQASQIEVELAYSRAGLTLRVRDNGAGIDSVTLGVGKKGHWGLSGMRERASKLGAKLDIWSKGGVGTEIELSIPQSVAFLRRQPLSIWQRLLRANPQRSEHRG